MLQVTLGISHFRGRCGRREGAVGWLTGDVGFLGFGFLARIYSFEFFVSSWLLFTSFKHFSSCTIYIREEISKILKCFALTVRGKMIMSVSFH